MIRTSKQLHSRGVAEPDRELSVGNRNSRARSRAVAAVAVTVAFVTVLPFVVDAYASASHASLNTPSGLLVRQLNGKPFGVRTAVRVLTFDGSNFSLESDLANHEVDGGLETPSSMCRSTVGCVAAVNGDYYDVTPKGQPDPGDEVGGVIQDCVLLHTPEISHQQVSLDGQDVGENLDWSINVNVNGVNVPISSVNQELPMKYPAVNLPLAGNLLFTAPYALRTPSSPNRLTYEFTQLGATTGTATTTIPTTTTSTVSSPTVTTGPTTTTTTLPTIFAPLSPTTINASTELELVAHTADAVRVRAGDVDISVPVGSSFASLQVGDTVNMTTTSTGGCDNIGGHPILLDHGTALPLSAADLYMRQKYARTVIGWTASNQTIILIVGGTDDKSGATGHQLIGLLRSLHVVTALNLDGGDSTSLYANGRLYYHARNGERPVSTALLVVRKP